MSMNRLQVSRRPYASSILSLSNVLLCASISVAAFHSTVDGEVSAAAEAEVAVHYHSPRGSMIVEESMTDCDGVR